MLRSLSLAVLLVACCATAVGPPPSGLLCEHRSSPALGVSLGMGTFKGQPRAPRLNWVLSHQPACAVNQMQHSYQVQLFYGHDSLLWDSGKQISSVMELSSNQEAGFPTHKLGAGQNFKWRVKTWSNSPSTENQTVCESRWSETATFSTALWAGMADTTSPIWYPGTSTRYGLFRKDVALPTATLTAAIAHVTAAQSGDSEKLLGAYRLYVNGKTVGIGPGRGEKYVKDADRTTYDIIGVTRTAKNSINSGFLALALQCFHQDGGAAAKVLLELHLSFSDGI